MSELKLHLFASARVELDGVAIKIGRRTTMSLLAYLAVAAGNHRRETLATLLWPDVAATMAHSYLRRDLSELIKALGKEWLNVTGKRWGSEMTWKSGWT